MLRNYRKIKKVLKIKRKNKEKVDVNYSKAHRRRRFWRKGHWVKRSKAYRNKAYDRNPRSTKEEIEKRGGTRKEMRKKKRETKFKRFGKPRERPARRSMMKKEIEESNQTTINKKIPRNRPARRSIEKSKGGKGIQTKII